MSRCNSTSGRLQLAWLAIALGILLTAPILTRADFTTIINVPPKDFPLSIGSDTQLNVSGPAFIGIVLSEAFNAGSVDGSSTNVEFNMTSRIIVGEINANRGSTVNLMSGSFNSGLTVNGGKLNMTGGSIQSPLSVSNGATVTLSAGNVGDTIVTNSLVNISGVASVAQIFANAGSTINFASDDIGDDLQSLNVGSGALVNVSRGDIAAAEVNSGGSLTMSGGTVSTNVSFVHVNDGGIVNVSGGTVGKGEFIIRGGTANILGGTTGLTQLELDNHGVANVSGGVVVGNVLIRSGTEMRILGGEFRLNGVPIDGLDTIGDIVQFNLPSAATLSGILADGTPFAFSSEDFDSIANGALLLQSATLPTLGPSSISVPSDAVPKGVRDAQTLTVASGGNVGTAFRAGDGATVNVLAGGAIGTNFEAAGTAVNVSGGSIGTAMKALHGTTVTVTSGAIGSNFRAVAGSEVTITGGSIGSRFNATSGSAVTAFGGDFYLDGVPIGGLESSGNSTAVNIPAGSVLAGILTDGRIFILSPQDGDDVADGTLTLRAASIPATGPQLIVAPQDAVPLYIHNGQTLVVNNGGTVAANFGANWGSHVIIESGGTVNSGFEAAGSTIDVRAGANVGSLLAYDSTVNITGGTVTQGMSIQGSAANITGATVVIGLAIVRAGSTVNLTAGNVHTLTVENGIANISGAADVDYFSVQLNGTANVSGGIIGDNVSTSRPTIAGTLNMSGGSVGWKALALPGSIVNLSGGSISRIMDAQNGSVLNFSGGSIGSDFDADSGCTVNIFGTQFVVAGSDITSTLTENVPFTVTTRNVILSGVLVDGSPFDFQLNATNSGVNIDYFHPGATLTITLVSGIAGDFNSDGTVNAADYTVWRNAIGTTVAIRGKGGDGNFDGKVTQADYFVWKAHFGESTNGGPGPAVPEPAGLVLGLLAAAGLFAVRNRRGDC